MSASAADWINLILLGGLLGAVGQGIRVVVGLKKVNDQALQEKKEFSALFSPATLIVSLLVGFIAGVLGILSLPNVNVAKLDPNQVLLPLLGIGYAGADFIEGFVKKNTAQFTGGKPAGSAGTQPPSSPADNPEPPAMG
jgi:F0F1-type ATP synthase membrane subunit c/vacuolar-type H+-ATPase subunit K